MRIISFNVNGLRAIMNKGFIDFINKYKPDILGLQETKLQANQVPSEINNINNYYLYWNFAERKGYSGTALFSLTEPEKVTYDIGDARFNGEGRIIQAEYANFVLFNIYFPNGQSNSERLQYKLDFYDQFLIHIETLRSKGKNILIMGDFNTAHKEIDLSHPKENSKFSGFLPVEREWIDKLVDKGYIDTFRKFDQQPKKYTWWTYRLKAREKNIGWRIDYCFVNKEFISEIKEAFILNDVMGSDHCPVGVEIY